MHTLFLPRAHHYYSNTAAAAVVLCPSLVSLHGRYLATCHVFNIYAQDTKPTGEYDSHSDNGLRVAEMFGVANKVALVTGGSIGIGRMIAEGLAVNGCKVYITSRKLKACEVTAAELNEIASGSGGEVIPFASDLGTVKGCQVLLSAHLFEHRKHSCSY